MASPKLLRVITRCSTRPEFLSTFGRFVDETSIFVATHQPRPCGVTMPFAIALEDGEAMLRGEAEVVESHTEAEGVHKRPGMRLRIIRLDGASRDTHAELLARKRASAAAPPAIPADAQRGRALAGTGAGGAASTSVASVSGTPSPETRVPGSSYVVPANPFTELPNAALEYFVDCTLYEETMVQPEPAELPPPPFVAPPVGHGPGSSTHGAPPVALDSSAVRRAAEIPDAELVPPRRPIAPYLSAVLGAVIGLGGGYFMFAQRSEAPVAAAPPVIVTTESSPPAKEPSPPGVVKSEPTETASPAAVVKPAESPTPPTATPTAAATAPTARAPAVAPTAASEAPASAKTPAAPSTVSALNALAAAAPAPSAGASAPSAGAPASAGGPSAGAAASAPSAGAPASAPSAGAAASAGGPSSPEPAKPAEPAAAKPAPLAAAAPAAVVAPSAPRAPGSGCRASITTDPPDAPVRVDGTVIGRTPLVDHKVPCGDILVSVEHPRYEKVERHLTISDGRDARVELHLTRPPGVLDLRSSPPGASFTVNGASAGHAPTSAKVSAFTFVNVRASLEGYGTWTQRVYVLGPRMSVTAPLEPGTASSNRRALKSSHRPQL
jgi:hypothetical protein